MELPLSTCTAALAPVALHPLAAIFDPSVYRIILFDQRNCGRSLPNAADMADTFVTAWELSRAWPESRLVIAEDAAHSVS